MKKSFKKMLKADIEQIDTMLASSDSGKQLCYALVSKYSSYDEKFHAGLPCLPAEVIGSTAPSYKTNLLAVKGKLETILYNNESTRFYHKEGFWPGFFSGLSSSLVASGIITGLTYLVRWCMNR